MGIDLAGASKALYERLEGFNSYSGNPIYSILRSLGFLVLFAVIYLGLVVNKMEGDLRYLAGWIAGYAFYLLALEYTVRKFRRFYETTAFRMARALANTVIFTVLIRLSPKDAYLLAFLYAIPLLSTIAYNLPRWFKVFVYLLIAGCLYVSAISIPEVPALSILQYLLILAILIGSAFALRQFYLYYQPAPGGLPDLIRSLHQEIDLNNLLKVMVESCIKMSSAERALIFIIEPETRRYIVHASQGFKLEPGRSLEEFIEKCQVAKTGESYRSSDMWKEYGARSIYYRFFHIQPRSVEAEPIFNREGKLLGVINLIHSKPRQFDPNVIQKITSFSHLVGSLVENCLIDRRAQINVAKSDRSCKRLADAGDEQQVVSTLIEEAKQRLPKADGVVVHRFEGKTETLQPVYSTQGGELLPWDSSDIEQENLGKTKMRYGMGIAGRSLLLKESILVPDVSQHPWFEQSSNPGNLQSLLAAPILDPSSSDPIGTISVYSSDPGAFTTNDEMTLVALAYQAASAILRIRSFSVWREHGGQLKQVLDEVRGFDLDADRETLCRQIAESAVRVLDFKMARIRLLDEEKKGLRTFAVEGIPESENLNLKKSIIPLSVLQPFLTDEFRAGPCFLVPHEHPAWEKVVQTYFYVDPRLKDKQQGWRAFDAFLIPLNSLSGELIGLLTLDMPENGLLPTAQSIEEVGVFASMAAWTLEMSAAQKHIAEQQNQIKVFIQAVSEKLARARDIRAVGEVAVQAGVNVFSAEGASFFLVKGNVIELANSSFLWETSYIGRQKPVSEEPGCGLTAYVAATGKPLFFQDTSYQQHLAWAGEKDHLHNLPSRTANSLMIVPIKAETGDHVLGVLSLENKKTEQGVGSFEIEDFEKFNLFVKEVGRAIGIIERYKAIETLEKNSMEDEVHDLLTWHQMGVVMPLDSSLAWLDRGQMDRVKQELVLALHRAHTVADELKSIHTAMSSRYLEEKYLADSLKKLVEAWKMRVSPKDWELPVTVECPIHLELPEHLNSALVRIASSAIANSVKHSGMLTNRDICVSVIVTKLGNWITLQIIDNGVGLEEGEFKAGYGITRMRNLVDKLNKLGYESKIKIQSNRSAGKGTTVAVETCLKVNLL